MKKTSSKIARDTFIATHSFKANSHKDQASDLKAVCEYVKVTNDCIFKYLFGTEEHKAVLIDLLNTFLHDEIRHEIHNLTFIDKEPVSSHLGQKDVRYDICCSLDRGEKINIEVQLVNHYDMNKRAVMYWSRLHTSSAAKGKQYKETTPSITFNILNFVLFHHHLRPFSRYVALDLESLLYHDCDPTIRLSDDFCICFLELPKFKFSEHKKLSKQ